ncbi:MAG TPA: glycine cleavage T C-terminal barrel domain-containing protein [Anaeromyxobacteraceae bacterium]|nr:glycine cleavage T C-terminal barrel domain-containing protein [Anaeromyxobacteraceae bacterium]
MTLSERLAAARTGAAVGPVTTRGILRFRGLDARDYLHRMSTQSLAAIAPGASAYAAFLDARGHLVGEGLVAARQGDLLLVVESAELDGLRDHLRKYLVADDVTVEDLSPSLRDLPVLGPKGVARALALRKGEAMADTPRRGVVALEVIASPEVAEGLRRELLAEGAADLSEADLEVLRIEEGIARFGADMDGDRLPMEAGLTTDAIHLHKGCYIGQEVVLRATMRGHLQKGLVQLRLPDGAECGTRLRADGAEVGWVTSAAETTRGRLGLGYLRRAYWKVGAQVEAGAGEAVVTKVIVHEPD